MASVDLERFRHAQEAGHATFATALREIRAGSKRSHWIWYVFPQLEGLGTSDYARTYAIHDMAEAIAYLDDAVLSERLMTITRSVSDQLRKGVDLETLMGSHIDAIKLVSSLTLFAEAADTSTDSSGRTSHRDFAAVAREVLTMAAAQGFPPCQRTLNRLRTRGA